MSKNALLPVPTKMRPPASTDDNHLVFTAWSKLIIEEVSLEASLLNPPNKALRAKNKAETKHRAAVRDLGLQTDLGQFADNDPWNDEIEKMPDLYRKLKKKKSGFQYPSHIYLELVAWALVYFQGNKDFLYELRTFLNVSGNDYFSMSTVKTPLKEVIKNSSQKIANGLPRKFVDLDKKSNDRTEENWYSNFKRSCFESIFTIYDRKLITPAPYDINANLSHSSKETLWLDKRFEVIAGTVFRRANMLKTVAKKPVQPEIISTLDTHEPLNQPH